MHILTRTIQEFLDNEIKIETNTQSQLVIDTLKKQRNRRLEFFISEIDNSTEVIKPINFALINYTQIVIQYTESQVNVLKSKAFISEIKSKISILDRFEYMSIGFIGVLRIIQIFSTKINQESRDLAIVLVTSLNKLRNEILNAKDKIETLKIELVKSINEIK